MKKLDLSYYAIHLLVLLFLTRITIYMWVTPNTDNAFKILFSTLLGIDILFILSVVIPTLFKQQLPYQLRYEIDSKMMGGDGVTGTIRTVPQNYYVASVNTNKQLTFRGLESNTRDINKKAVQRWFKNNK